MSREPLPSETVGAHSLDLECPAVCCVDGRARLSVYDDAITINCCCGKKNSLVALMCTLFRWIVRRDHRRRRYKYIYNEYEMSPPKKAKARRKVATRVRWQYLVTNWTYNNHREIRVVPNEQIKRDNISRNATSNFYDNCTSPAPARDIPISRAVCPARRSRCFNLTGSLFGLACAILLTLLLVLRLLSLAPTVGV